MGTGIIYAIFVQHSILNLHAEHLIINLFTLKRQCTLQ